MDASDIYAIDRAMIKADGTKDKSKLGANAILAVSIACWCAEVFHALAAILKDRGLATSVGDEGGFVPALKSDEDAIETILEAVKKAGYEPGKDFRIAMDAASSEWKTGKTGEYKLPKAGTVYTSDELIAHWKKLVEKYPIISIEDALDEEDWEGWKKLTAELGDKVQLVGDARGHQDGT